MGENRFLYREIKYSIFGLIPKTSYVTQTLNIKYRGIIEPWATVNVVKILIWRKKNVNSVLNFIQGIRSTNYEYFVTSVLRQRAAIIVMLLYF